MMNENIRQVQHIWSPVARYLYVPHTEEEYRELVNLLDALTDIVGEDEQHPLASLMEILSVLIEKYEDEYVPEIAAV